MVKLFLNPMSRVFPVVTLLVTLAVLFIYDKPPPSHSSTPFSASREYAASLRACAPPAAAASSSAASTAATPRECFPPNPSTCEGICGELQQKILHDRAQSTWPAYYSDITAEIYRRGAQEGVFVEVGTAFGGLAAHVLDTFPDIRVIAVDPFYGDYDTGDDMSFYFRGLRETYGQKEAAALWARAMAFDAGKKHGCRYSLYNMESVKAAAMFPQRSVDMIFIDGDHTRKGVDEDIAAWAPIVKEGRMLLFNDYQPDRWPGVVQAVDGLAERTAQPVYWLPQKSWGNVGLFNVPELFAKNS